MIFYVLTTLSCLGAFLIDVNTWKAIIGPKKDFYSFRWEFFTRELGVSEFNSWGKFITVVIITAIVACLIVVAHVYYSYYFANKITVAVKQKLAKKLFSLQGNNNEKKTLSVLAHNPRIFSYLIIFVPNQIYYMLFSTLLTFISIGKAAKTSGNYSLVFWGIAYWVLILAIVILFQYFVYRKDQPFQKSLKKETERENFLVNNRNLIIKKNLTSSSLVSYDLHLNNSRQAANKRDFIYTLSYVTPSYSLVRMAGFIFAPFATDENTKIAVINLIGLSESTKKMSERLKDYPYGLSAQKQINDFLQLPERDDIQKNVLILEPVENIILKKVSFNYEENKPVLKELDREFKVGKVNHLTGENASGKSTIISLIMGLYQPNEGEILINNKYKVSEINLIEWRKKIAYAEHNNLIENSLSTGQKQLADLDKLFENSKNKEVFIFDEADNALDENNKKEFRQKIEKISKNKLVILISH